MLHRVGRCLLCEEGALNDVLAFLVFFALFIGKDVCPPDLALALFAAHMSDLMATRHHLCFFLGAVAQVVGSMAVKEKVHLRFE